jgi:hypothetical protein
MVASYFKNYYSPFPNADKIPSLTYDEAMRLCRCDTGNNGTRVNHSLMKEIEEAFGKALRLRLNVQLDLEELHDRRTDGLPTIVIYDGRYLRDNLKGPAHAGVYIGRTAKGDPILNNPWFGETFIAPIIDFKAAWEIRNKSGVLFDPNMQTLVSDDAASHDITENLGGLQDARGETNQTL